VSDTPATLTRGAWETAPEASESSLLVERLLRQPESIWRQIAAEHELGRLNGRLLLASWATLSIHGAVLGASSSVLQALASAVKLPVLFLLTLAICLPALYVFNLVFGSRLRAGQTLALVLCAIATTGVLTLGFAPISVFFLLSARDYGFFKLLNVAILAVTGLAGLKVLTSGMHAVQNPVSAERGPEPAPAPEAGSPPEAAPRAAARAKPRRGNPMLLRGWLLVYAFVGTQLAWTLRPFFGAPDLPFELFRRLEGNFYVNIIQTLFG